MKVIAFAASNSKQSINKKLLNAALTIARKQGKELEIEILDINDFEMPLYSIDREHEQGIPELAHQFKGKLESADLLLISFAEHNGSYTAAYKNLYDWTSRIDMKVYKDLKTLLLATSPGPGGANTVLTSAVGSFPYFGADVKGHFSLPSFFDHFNPETEELLNQGHKEELVKQVESWLVD